MSFGEGRLTLIESETRQLLHLNNDRFTFVRQHYYDCQYYYDCSNYYDQDFGNDNNHDIDNNSDQHIDQDNNQDLHNLHLHEVSMS